MTGAMAGRGGRSLAKSTRRMLLICLFVLTIIMVSAFLAASADAAETSVSSGATGTVIAEALNVRSGAGTLNSVLGMVYMGDTVTILGSETDYMGTAWYKISFQSGSGYISSDYVTINSNNQYVYDEAFEQELTQQGFPESYKPYLRQLHADYPNWVFQACYTGISWSDAVDQESKPGVSLVSGTSPSSWKSMEPGAFDFDTWTYIQYDSGNWVTASRAIIEYYMDPRNFLNSGGIFQFLTHSYDGRTQTSEGLASVLSGTFMGGAFPEEGYETYNQVLMEVGAKTFVNPYVLASMILVEQGSTGIGKSISGTVSGYEGIYNHFNVGAYASGGMDAVTRGLWYASQSGAYGRPWNSIYKSIYGGAMFYSQNYVQNNKYTLYLKKFNVMNGLSNVGQGQYMTNIQGAESEAAALRKGYVQMLDQAMTFLIPVYNNMPSSACLKPQNAANNNNYLSSLTVSGYSLSPAFSSQQTSYTVQVPAGTKSVIVSAKVSDTSASVSGTGTVTLTAASQTVKIIVTAPSGVKRTYSITFVSSSQDPTGKITAGVQNTTIKAGSALTEAGTIRLDWTKSPGYKVDYYEVFRSTARYTGFGTKAFYTTSDGTKNWYINTKGLEPGNTYYYLIRGVREIDGETVYTQWSNKCWRTIKAASPEETDVPDDSDPSDSDSSEDPGSAGSASESSNTEVIRLGVQNTTIKVSSTLTEAGTIRLDWIKSAGYKVDYYEVFRSTARYTGFGTKAFYTTASGTKTWYINTKGLVSGNTYYYKVRGVRVIDGETVYTQWSTKAWRTIK